MTLLDLENNSVSLQKSYILGVVQHIFHIVLVSDIVGRNIGQYVIDERKNLLSKWLKTSKGKYPKLKDNPEYTNVCTQLSDISIALMDILLRHDPIVNGVVPILVEELENLKNVAESKFDLQVAACVVYPMYAAVSKYRYGKLDPNMFRLAQSTLANLYVDKGYNTAVYALYSSLMFKLIEEGYLRLSQIESSIALYENNRYSQLIKKLDSKDFPAYLSKCKITYLEHLCLLAIWYVYSYSSSTSRVKSEDMYEIVATNGVGMRDMLFLYSALFAASEHSAMFYIKPLIESTQYYERVKALTYSE